MKEQLLIVSGFLTPSQKETLEEFCRKNDYGLHCVSSVEEAEPFLADATIIYGTRAALIEGAPNLKWFSSGSAGVNTYLPVIKPETILTNSAGAYGLSISEHIIMVSLMMLREMPQFQERIANRTWKGQIHQDSLYGQRITVVGTGDIGSNFARRVRAFMPERIIGISRSGKLKDGFDSCYPIEKLDEVLPETTLLVLCVPETAETIDLITKERLYLLPEGARLVNVGRGTVLDEDALVEALESGHLKAAALDVFRVEPLPANSVLYHTRNLILTPHCSGNLTLDYTLHKNFDMFFTNLRHYAAGEPLEHVVDKKLQY